MSIKGPPLDANTEMTRAQAVAEQLDAAVELFFQGRHVAAITLAGAAERVLSDLLKASGIEPSSKFLLKYREMDLGTQVDPKEFHKWQVEVYDWLRHADQHPEATAVVAPMEALMWVMRGVASFRRLTAGGSTPTMDQFHVYWAEHFDGDPSE